MYNRKEEREYFSKVLNKLFLEKDITKTYFAELSGISLNKICNYLKGTTFPVGEDFHKLAKFFGYTFNEFWGLTHNY